MRQRLEIRAKYLRAARAYFMAQNVLEVETPILSNCAVTDPHVNCIGTGDKLFLRPSPESALKQLLAQGSGDIFEIGRVFRDGEAGSRHNPEFTMAEWYRINFGLRQIITDTVNFITHLASESPHPVSRVEQQQYRELFRETTRLDPLNASAETLADYAMSTLADQLSPDLRKALGDDRQGWLDLLMSLHIEPKLPPETLTVITHYPAEQSLLARLSDEFPGTAERFEIYYRGYELANGFHELADPQEQRQRFVNDQKIRAAAGVPVPVIDEALLNALKTGLPDCSGVAVGIDRVIMGCEGYQQISETLALQTATDKNADQN